MKRVEGHILYFVLLAAAVFVSFWILDTQAISTGDDLGYMFTDSSLHSGDGHRVNSFNDCLSTQLSHYLTTNGRFLVHVAVQYMVSVAPVWLFPVLNAFMFLVLWYIVLCRSGLSRRWQTGSMVWLMLWLLLPAPGVNMLSLKAYSINYMWTAVAILLIPQILQLPQTKIRNVAAIIFIFLAGTLQESFGLPVSATLVTYFIICRCRKRKIEKIYMASAIAFIAGTAICVAAPGNFNHAMQGGGMTADAVLNRLNALGKVLIFSPMTILATATLLLGVTGSSLCKKFINKNLFIYLVVIFSLLLACATFTSSRQLFCPSLFSIILLLRMAALLHPSRICVNITGGCCLLLTVAMLACAYNLRSTTARTWNSFICGLKSSENCDGWTDASNSNYNHPERYCYCLNRFDADPFANRELKIVFDSYTRNGLSRLIGRKIYSVFPLNPDSISDKAISHGIISGNKGTATAIDNAYSCFAVAGKLPKRFYRSDDTIYHIPYARIKKENINIYVVPFSDSVIIIR